MRRVKNSCRLVVALLLGCAAALATPSVHAASPKLNNILPIAGQRGQTVEVKFYGQRLDDASAVLLHTQGITPEHMTIQRGRSVTASFRIAPDAPLGEHQVRLLTETGVTEMLTFHVVDQSIVMERYEEERGEKSNSTSFENPQPVELGAAVIGRTHQEDVDYYAVDLKKGQRLSVQVDGMRLGRGFTDSHIAVFDVNQKKMAECDDTHLLRQDPVIGMVAPEDGRYVIAIRDSGYAGSNNNWYLMHVGGFVRPTAVFPLGGKPGEEIDLTFMGDAQGNFAERVRLPGSINNEHRVLPNADGKRPPSGLPFRVNQLTNVCEDGYPKNDSMKDMEQAPVHTPPVALNGVIGSTKDNDYYKLALKKGQSVLIRCYASTMGSPLDPVVNVFNAKDKKHLQGNDDAPTSADSVLTFKAPADGEYFVRVRDHRHRGGADFVYRVEVTRQTPSLSTSIERYDRDRPQTRQAVAVPQGGRTAALIRVNRRSVGGDLMPSFEGLPDGLTVTGHAPQGQQVMPIVFEAGGDAPLGAAMADLGVQGTRPGGSAEPIRGSFRQTTPLVIANPNRTEYYHSILASMPVAVTRPAPVRLEIVEPKAPIVRDGVMRLKVNLQRDGFDRRVRLHLLWRPPGVGGAGQLDLNKDQVEGNYNIDANANAELREWPMVVHGYAETERGQVWISSQLFKLKVEEPFVIGKIEKASCDPGDTVDIVVNLEHPREWQGEGELKLMGVPAGCKVETMQVKPGQKQAVFRVQTDAKTPPGRHGSLMCELTIQVNGEPVVHRFGRGGQLRVDRPSKAGKKLKQKQAKQATKE